MQVGEQHEKPTSLCVFLPCDLNQVKENVLGISAISKNKNEDGERVDSLILFLAFQGLIFESSYCFMKAFLFVCLLLHPSEKNKQTYVSIAGANWWYGFHTLSEKAMCCHLSLFSGFSTLRLYLCG